MTHPYAIDYDETYQTHPELRDGADFIITGNTWDEYGRIMEETNPDIPIFFNPGRTELMDIVTHKADIINKTGVIKFWEDQSDQADMLKILCPKCTIILVK